LSDVIPPILVALRQDREVREALERVLREDELTLADQCAVTEIAAPRNGEAQRADWFSARLQECGVATVECDQAGNVIGTLAGDATRAPIVLAAHLDTVFAADTDVVVRRSAGALHAPGIADNSRGLAAVLRGAAVLARLPRRHPLLIIGTVGEEGAGDLRGVKCLFGDVAFRPAAFVAVDGAGMSRIVHRGVGSRRLRIALNGAGGHSWSNRDRPNPVHALGSVIAGLESLRRASGRDAAVNVGRVGGGTSINAIPAGAWLELDLRAATPTAIATLESRARRLVDSALARHTPLEAAIEVIGDRPGGELMPDHLLVRAAAAVTRSFGVEAELAASSTDANVPLALGVPAIALGAGGTAGGTHTLAEWYRNDGGVEGIQRLVLLAQLLDAVL
jgi:acetylornithine deacetylase/succinyl-diaminopimelate desuccinylase-like protein